MLPIQKILKCYVAALFGSFLADTWDKSGGFGRQPRSDSPVTSEGTTTRVGARWASVGEGERPVGKRRRAGTHRREAGGEAGPGGAVGTGKAGV